MKLAHGFFTLKINQELQRDFPQLTSSWNRSAVYAGEELDSSCAPYLLCGSLNLSELAASSVQCG